MNYPEQLGNLIGKLKYSGDISMYKTILNSLLQRQLDHCLHTAPSHPEHQTKQFSLSMSSIFYCCETKGYYK